jgi:hypothetical protein
MGFTHISEDSSEIAFLLVENYNHDRSKCASVCLGIFGTKPSRERPFFIANSFVQAAVKEKKMMKLPICR